MDMEQLRQVRIENVRRLVRDRYGGNASQLARDAKKKSSYINDVTREGSTKSFAERAARNIEDAAMLLRGQLDIPNSDLIIDLSKSKAVPPTIDKVYQGMTLSEKSELHEVAMRIVGRRKKSVRRSGRRA